MESSYEKGPRSFGELSPMKAGWTSDITRPARLIFWTERLKPPKIAARKSAVTPKVSANFDIAGRKTFYTVEERYWSQSLGLSAYEYGNCGRNACVTDGH